MADKIFVGRVFDAKFSRGKLVLNKADLDLLTANLKDDKVSVLLKDSKAGKPYAEIDTWQPTEQTVQSVQQIQQKHNPQAADIGDPLNDLPF